MQEKVFFFFWKLWMQIDFKWMSCCQYCTLTNSALMCSSSLLCLPHFFSPLQQTGRPSNRFQQTRVWKWGASRWRRTNEGLTGQLDCSMSFRSHIFSRCSRSFSSCSLVLRSLSSFFSLSSVASISHLQKTAAEKKNKFFSQNKCIKWTPEPSSTILFLSTKDMNFKLMIIITAAGKWRSWRICGEGNKLDWEHKCYQPTWLLLLYINLEAARSWTWVFRL